MSYYLLSERPRGQAASRAMMIDSVERFRRLEYGWGRKFDGLPLRPDSAQLVLALAALPDVRWTGIRKAWLTRHGVPCYRFEALVDRLPHSVVVRVVCGTAVQFTRNRPPNQKSNSIADIADGVIHDAISEPGLDSLKSLLTWVFKPPSLKKRMARLAAWEAKRYGETPGDD